MFSLQKVEDHRRKWDREEYERLAKERIEEEQEAQLKPDRKDAPPKRDLLTPRDYRVSAVE